MCTLLFSWQNTPGYKLVLIANRDEFYRRETKTAHWWEDEPGILAGRDLKAGGTWMGIHKNGRIAAVTNFRKLPLEAKPDTSRGDLVRNFLNSGVSPHEYLEFLRENGQDYEGFNLVFGTTSELYYFSNRDRGFELSPGIYGLSNHLLDTPWPKVENGKQRFREILENRGTDRESLFELLKNKKPAPDDRLPQTGLSPEMERLVSSIFIESPEYGTRLSTVVTIDNDNHVEFHERSFVPKDAQSFSFPLESN